MIEQTSLIDLRLALASVLVLIGPPSKAAPLEALTIGQGERLLVISPHPDDEVLSSGGLIQSVLDRKGQVRVIVATAGDGFVEAVERDTGRPHPGPSAFLKYGESRQTESRKAVQVLGAGRIRIDFLGFPDGGIHALLASHWSRLHPKKSLTTETDRVAYPDTVDRNTPYDGRDLRGELVRILRSFRPSILTFPDAMDWHPDHDGLGMFALLAMDEWLSGRRFGRGKHPSPPKMLTYLIHWYHGWPAGSRSGDREVLSNQPLFLPPDLPLRGHARVCLPLAPRERAIKQDALAQYQSQQRIMARFLAAFVRSTECFSSLTPKDASDLDALVEGRLRLRRTAARQSLPKGAISRR